jgi:putative component of toxin-antitoxin plasmid stabilization module
MDKVEWRMDKLELRMDKLERRMDEGFKELRIELGAMHRTMVQFAGVMVAALATLFAAQIALLVTQL